MVAYINGQLDADYFLEQRLWVAENVSPGLLTYLTGKDCTRPHHFIAAVDEWYRKLFVWKRLRTLWNPDYDPNPNNH